MDKQYNGDALPQAIIWHLCTPYWPTYTVYVNNVISAA